MIKNFLDYKIYKNLSKEFEKFLRREIKNFPEIVSSASLHLNSAGGKRLRPLILLLVSEILSYRGKDRFLMASVVETIHMASLIHDDVIDEADLRRGKKTLNKLFGNHLSILIGDFLYAKAISNTLRVKNFKIMDVLSLATVKMIEGEIFGQKNLRNPDLKIPSYIKLIKNKTGYLFAASASIPSILSKKEEYFEPLFNFGLNFGIFFQILDDTMDFIAKEEETGKPVLHDLEEGKINLPVLLLLRELGSKEKEKLKDYIRNSSKYKNEIKKMVEDFKTHKKAIEIAKKYNCKGINYLKFLPDKKAKKILLSIPEILLSSKFFKNL